eukprot:13690151-Alexandrium_andersonii.AAC.1
MTPTRTTPTSTTPGTSGGTTLTRTSPKAPVQQAPGQRLGAGHRCSRAPAQPTRGRPASRSGAPGQPGASAAGHQCSWH